ncbi:hypothetical protein [Flagellimonas pacifica]|uniref:Uncharacterized protein n=1 Tax=Flagellimonas pacifica TaxID=1247520 RepID=A0A285MW48_9FLAO|nr:hypothetical protein [Allomuricauda parva]SNY99691.1 hypothetical protein SAMN06265377_1502 [Allomuricauda parva]
MQDIDLIKGCFIHKSIVLPNLLVLQLKHKLSNENAQLSIMFKDFVYYEDIRLNDLKIADFSIQKRIGMKHVYLINDLNKDPKQYNLFSIFDLNKEIKISTGIKKKVVIEVLFRQFILSHDIYHYKKII